MTTIAELIQLPRFSDIKLLTAQQDLLNRTVTSIEITETPDVEHFIPENVFLLMTGMIFKDDQTAMKPFIDSLVRAKVAGLAIKTGRFLHNHIPEDILAYADSKQIPIFNIPDSLSLGYLLHQFSNILWNSKQLEMDYALDIQKKFSNLLMQDATNEVIIQQFSHMIQSPIILLNPFGEVIAASSYFDQVQHPVHFYVDQVRQYQAQQFKESRTMMIQTPDGKSIQISLIPIKVFNYYVHYLVILHPELIPYPFSTFALEQAALVLTFNLYKNQQIFASKVNLEAELFKQIIEPASLSSLSMHLVKDASMVIQNSQTNYYQAIVVEIEGLLGTNSQTRFAAETYQLTFEWLLKHLQTYLKDTDIFYFANQHTLILINYHRQVKFTESLLQIRNQLDLIANIKLLFNVGNPVENQHEIAQSYMQAQQAQLERQKNQNIDLIYQYHDQGIYHLFNQMNEQDKDFFCKNVLKDFAHPHDDTLLELRNTLKVYLDAQCEITKTANLLFVHRNTVKYRIQKCEELLGLPINDPIHSLNIRLALALSEVND